MVGQTAGTNRIVKVSFGFTLIEVIVSIGIFAVITSAIIAILIQVIYLNSSTQLKAKATRYAEEGIEQSKDFFQVNSWANLYAKGISVTCAPTSSACYTDGSFSQTISGCSPLTPPGPCAQNSLNPCALSPVANESNFWRYGRLVYNNSTGQIYFESAVYYLDHGVTKCTVMSTSYYDYTL